MDEQFITSEELLILIGLGTLLPWIIATLVQYFIYRRKGIGLVKNVISSLLIFIFSALIGLVLWISFPVLVMPWQYFILSFKASIVNFLAFIPVLPMTLSTLISSFTIMYLYTRGSKNA